MQKILFLFSLIATLSGCAMGQRTTFYQLGIEGKVGQKPIDRLLWENSLSADKNAQDSIILDGDYANYHLLQLRFSEDPHLHEKHDLMVLVQSGRGVMHLKDQSFAVSPGSIIFIPRKIVHYFVNSGVEPAVAIAVFSPPYYGDDSIPIPAKRPVPEEQP